MSTSKEVRRTLVSFSREEIVLKDVIAEKDITKIYSKLSVTDFYSVNENDEVVTIAEHVCISLPTVASPDPLTSLSEVRGVVDRWIAVCSNIEFFSGGSCYSGFLKYWNNTEAGRLRFNTITDPAADIIVDENQINGNDAVHIPSPLNSYLKVVASDNNSDYVYLHSDKAWYVIIWEQVSTTLAEAGTLIQNDNYTINVGFSLFVNKDTDTDPNSFGVRIIQTPGGGSGNYINVNTGTNKVRMGAWNYAIVTWEDGAGIDGVSIVLNGGSHNFDNTTFSGSHSTSNSTKDIHVSHRSFSVRTGGFHTVPHRENTMRIAEIAMGNVGLSYSEICAIRAYIATKYAIADI